MGIFIAGLVIFFATHSVRIVAERWRAERIRRMGRGPWKLVYSLVSIAGFVLMAWGDGLARQGAVELWSPPPGSHYFTAVLTLLAFMLIAAAYVPGTRIKANAGHPMLIGTDTWALAHLLSNGSLADVMLFGSFFVWAIAAYPAARARDRKAGVTYPAVGASRDVIAIVIGAAAWAAFGWYLHVPLIGVPAFP